MTRAEITAYNAGISALAAIAEASADALRARLTEAPTRFSFAVAALEGIVAAAADVMLTPDDDETTAAALPKPTAPPDGSNGVALAVPA